MEEEEIPFEEFTQYYKNLLEVLNTGFAEFKQDECIKARYICSIGSLINSCQNCAAFTIAL